MPLADLEARRAYDRERAKAKNKGGSCIVCGTALPDGRRKLCGRVECRRERKTRQQRVYDRPGYVRKPLSPEALERRRERDRLRPSDHWSKRNPDGAWANSLRSAHGMTPEQWHAMWEAQGGMCYLGNHPLPDSRNRTVVDHDHNCCPNGRSCKFCRRGLACANCNSAIGLLSEDPALLRTVADNLERAHTRTAALIATKPAQMALLA